MQCPELFGGCHAVSYKDVVPQAARFVAQLQSAGSRSALREGDIYWQVESSFAGGNCGIQGAGAHLLTHCLGLGQLTYHLHTMQSPQLILMVVRCLYCSLLVTLPTS